MTAAPAAQHPSEAYVAELSSRTFLRLWTYPNVFRDTPTRQELCDLLVVFGNDVVVLSVKAVELQDRRDRQVEWAAWIKKAVKGSIKQIYGAEQWLRTRPTGVIVRRVKDGTESWTPLPVPIPATGDMRLHRIAVAFGSETTVRRFWGGDEGLIQAFGDMPGIDQMPYAVADYSDSGKFVHVFDRIAFDRLLAELDTARDLVDYLSDRERTLSSRNVLVGAEEALVARYLRTLDASGRHTLFSEDLLAHGGEQRGPSLIVVDAAEESEFFSTPTYREKKEADEVSYAWDKVIDIFASNLRAGTLLVGSAGEIEHERALRAMAAEPRVARRTLADAMLRAWTLPPDLNIRVTSVGHTSGAVGGVNYLFLGHRRASEDYDRYRRRRRVLLEHACFAVAVEMDDGRAVLGLAGDPIGEGGGHSEDLAMIENSRALSADEVAAARVFQETTGLLRNLRERMAVLKSHEYPAAASDSRAAQRTKHMQKPKKAKPRKRTNDRRRRK